MNTQTNKRLHLPLLGGGIAAILVSGIAIASLAISAQGSSGVFSAAEPLEAAAAPAIAAPDASASRCAECGVIESMRKIEAQAENSGVNAPGRIAAGNRGEIEGEPVGNYAITIRLRDGSMRVITDAHPARWRPGERVHLIGGME
jgi:outer membrane lipoprotein SlyB